MKNLVTQLIALILFITPAFALETGELRGKVTDAKTKMPLDYASIYLIKNGKNMASILSDDEGEYRIIKLGPGLYTLRVTYPGYEKTQINEIEILNETIVYQNVVMKSGGIQETLTIKRCCMCFSNYRESPTIQTKLDSAREIETWVSAQKNYAEECNTGFTCQLEHKSRAIEDKLKQKGVRLINQITVFPNPTSNILNLESMFDGRKKIRILNMAGMQLYSTDITHHAQLNTSTWKEGIYIVEVIDEFSQEKITERIIVQH